MFANVLTEFGPHFSTVLQSRGLGTFEQLRHTNASE